VAAAGEFRENSRSPRGRTYRQSPDSNSPAPTSLIYVGKPHPVHPGPVKGDVLAGRSKYRGIVMGGHSVKFDFDVTEKFFPLTRKNMDSRVIDIGLGELVRRWGNDYWRAMPAKLSDHTALTNIRARRQRAPLLPCRDAPTRRKVRPAAGSGQQHPTADSSTRRGRNRDQGRIRDTHGTANMLAPEHRERSRKIRVQIPQADKGKGTGDH
jgi:hypothetical protein